MDRATLKHLEDMRLSIDEIESYFAVNEKKFSVYESNSMLRSAIERKLEIIGEAANRILKENKGIAITNVKRIVGLRNRIIHSYDSISNTDIWAIIMKDLPILKQEIIVILEKYPDA